MNEDLQSDVLDRLERDDRVSDKVAHLALAALTGKIEDCLAGKTMSRAPRVSKASVEPVKAFVDSITVEGFRGIGPKATLSLNAGPGLTLIVGRNGSGKSSFSEALELLLTGDNQRWSAGRSKVWREGWRNLHHPQSARIEAKLLVEGRARLHTVARKWSSGESLENGETTVLHNGTTMPLASLGWHESIATYRPFLSYNELGSMLEEGPAKLFDALASILGLEELVAAADALKETRTSRTRVHKAVLDRLEEIRKTLEGHSDSRAAESLEALAGKPWKLDRVAALLTAQQAPDHSEIRNLRELATLQGPDPAAVTNAAQALRSALSAFENAASTNAEKARRRADLLEKALALHQHDGDGNCPVCGQVFALNETWHQQATEEVRRLRTESEAADTAHRNLAQAESAARRWITAPPKAVIDPELLNLWTAWRQGESKSGNELCTHLENLAPQLDQAIQETRRHAQAEVQKREDSWRPVAQALTEWLPGARRMLSEVEAVSFLKAAEDWLRTTATTIHNERFEPIKERVKKIWGYLRVQSHVDLEDVTFQGKSTARRVNLDVTVDGTRGTALGVMSQGELHALALSLFLPRATLESSPFRFVVIDDPVQAMDSMRVEGLAKVLDLVARKRQVVVLTHDDRLSEAIWRLHIKVRTIRVQRGEGSAVELREL